MDLIYIAILVGCGLISFGAAAYVKFKFNRGREVPIRSGYTGAEIARMILKKEGVDDVTVVEHQGFLSDHYDPTAKQLRLSPEVYQGQNAAAAGVAAHEVGHALQHAQGDFTMWGRTILVYPAHFGGMLAPYLVMIGIAMAAAQGISAAQSQGFAHYLAVGGVLLFGVASLCSIIIVFNEFNASARARTALINMGVTRPGEEDEMVQGVLLAAGLTYVAAAAAALLQLLYWAWKAGLIGGQRRE